MDVNNMPLLIIYEHKTYFNYTLSENFQNKHLFQVVLEYSFGVKEMSGEFKNSVYVLFIFHSLKISNRLR